MPTPDQQLEQAIAASLRDMGGREPLPPVAPPPTQHGLARPQSKQMIKVKQVKQMIKVKVPPGVRPADQV